MFCMNKKGITNIICIILSQMSTEKWNDNNLISMNDDCYQRLLFKQAITENYKTFYIPVSSYCP